MSTPGKTNKDFSKDIKIKTIISKNKVDPKDKKERNMELSLEYLKPIVDKLDG